MLRPPKFIDEWVTVAGLVYCSSILGDSAPIHFPCWLQKYRRFTDVTVNSCLRLQIGFSANPGMECEPRRVTLRSFLRRSFLDDLVSRIPLIVEFSRHVARCSTRMKKDVAEERFLSYDSTNQRTNRCRRNSSKGRGGFRLIQRLYKGACISFQLFRSAFLSFVKTCASRSRRRLSCGMFPESWLCLRSPGGRSADVIFGISRK